MQEECRHNRRPGKAQRNVISAPSFFQLLKMENTLFKITEFSFLISLPPMKVEERCQRRTPEAQNPLVHTATLLLNFVIKTLLQ